MPLHYLSQGLGKQSQRYRILEATHSESYGSDLGCDTFVAAADTEMVKDQFGSTNILYPSVKCTRALT